MDIQDFFAALRNVAANRTQEIYFEYSALGPDAVSLFVKALKSNTSLVRIDMPESYVGDAGMEELAKSLQKSAPNLKALRLRDNGIGKRGMKALAELAITRPELEIEGIEFSPRMMSAARRRDVTSQR